MCRNDEAKSSNASERVELVESKHDDDDCDYLFALNHYPCPEVDASLNGSQLRFKLDSCATVNVLDEFNFKKLKSQPKLENYTKPIYGYGSKTPLITVGKFSTSIKVKDRIVKADFVVMKGTSGNLLSYSTCKDLGLIEILNSIDNAGQAVKDMSYWKKKFPDVFTDKVGTYKDFLLELHIDRSVKPIQAKPRNKPFHLRKAIDKEIERKLKAGIIEEVVGEPTLWLSETVVVPKEGTNKVRLCTDMTAANTAIKREKYEMPDVEHIIYEANGMEVFRRIDLTSAFEQVELHPN